MTDAETNEHEDEKEPRHKPTREEAERKSFWKKVTAVGAAVVVIAGTAIVASKKLFGRSNKA